MTITIREPGSAITHFIGMVLAIFATIPMLVKASLVSTRAGIIAMAVFMTSMILLYTASTLYHSVNLRGHSLRFFQKIDHMMIFVLIAGSYTPVCLLVLNPVDGHRLLVTVWVIAAAGMLFKLFWVTCPKYVSSIIYVFHLIHFSVYVNSNGNGSPRCLLRSISQSCVYCHYRLTSLCLSRQNLYLLQFLPNRHCYPVHNYNPPLFLPDSV